MKTYSQFILESAAALNALAKISRNWGRRYRGVNIDASINKLGDIRLHNIWLPPELRNQGIGGRIMKGLANFADREGKRITLNQAPEKGQKARLSNFYSQHGFMPNKGKTRDFSTTDSYIRNPSNTSSGPGGNQ